MLTNALLNMFSLFKFLVSVGSAFHPLTARLLKKCFLTSVLLWRMVRFDASWESLVTLLFFKHLSMSIDLYQNVDLLSLLRQILVQILYVFIDI